ncbi:MAG: hypothetical protein Q4A82_03955 [Corynebacterium sp.]|nr:hypothetical protein [Corynebacterium sp.]
MSPTTTPPSLMRTLIKLHFTLWVRAMKANKSTIVINCFFVFYTIMGMLSVGVTLGMELADGHYTALSGAVAIGTFAYVMAAVMIPSGEGQLSPESFATMPLTTKQLMPSFILVQILQIRGFLAVFCTTITTIIVAACLLNRGASILTILLLIIAMILSLMVVIVLAESLAVLLAGNPNKSSSGKNLRVFLAFGSFIVGWLLYTMVFENNLSNANGTQNLATYGTYLQWSPFASAAGFATFSAQGQWLPATACLGITLATLGIGMSIWWYFTQKRLIAPLGNNKQIRSAHHNNANSNAEERRKATKTVILPGLPYTPTSAIYSRAIRYIPRDARQLIAIAMPPVMLLYFIITSWRQETPFMLIIGIIVIAIMSGMNATNDYGTDGPANWLHLSAGIPAKNIVLGRHLASITPAALTNIISYIITLTLFFSHELLLAVFIATGAAITIFGISLFLSVRNPYPMSPPGTNPWQDKSGFSTSAFISAFAGLLLSWIPLAPGIVAILYGNANDNLPIEITGVALALIIPTVLYLIVIRFAIRYVDKCYPEMFNKVRSYA